MKHGVAGGLASAAFLGFYLVLGSGLLIACAAALATLVGVQLLVSSERNEMQIILGQISDDDVRSLLEEVNLRLLEISKEVSAVTDNFFKAKVEDIVRNARLIMEKVAKEPRLARPARSFIVYSFDALLKIVKKYHELFAFKDRDPDIQRALSESMGTLGQLQLAMQKHHARLLSGDVADLDVEIKVLQSTMETEGYK